jgi:hypothetical protein
VGALLIACWVVSWEVLGWAEGSRSAGEHPLDTGDSWICKAGPGEVSGVLAVSPLDCGSLADDAAASATVPSSAAVCRVRYGSATRGPQARRLPTCLPWLNRHDSCCAHSVD